MNKCLFAILLSWSVMGQGAQAVLIGQGQVRSAPDYIELSITVDSKCYETPDEARKINDEAASKIVSFLNTKIKEKNQYNTVISTGGYTFAYQTYYQDKYWCQNTFQKQNTIVFKTQDVKNFESIFNEIQNVVYKEFSQNPPAVIQSSISYVTMSEPIPNVSSERQAQLEQKALALAFIDAKEKLYSLLGKAEIHNLKMTDASEISFEEPGPFFQKGGAALAVGMQRSARAPIQFDEKNISKIIYFKFTFDDISMH